MLKEEYKDCIDYSLALLRDGDFILPCTGRKKINNLTSESKGRNTDINLCQAVILPTCVILHPNVQTAQEEV